MLNPAHSFLQCLHFGVLVELLLLWLGCSHSFDTGMWCLVSWLSAQGIRRYGLYMEVISTKKLTLLMDELELTMVRKAGWGEMDWDWDFLAPRGRVSVTEWQRVGVSTPAGSALLTLFSNCSGISSHWCLPLATVGGDLGSFERTWEQNNEEKGDDGWQWMEGQWREVSWQDRKQGCCEEGHIKKDWREEEDQKEWNLGCHDVTDAV